MSSPVETIQGKRMNQTNDTQKDTQQHLLMISVYVDDRNSGKLSKKM